MTRSKRTAWDAAVATVTRLREAGHTALFAGGCVRDMLLGRNPKDYDVATDAVPDRVLELFPRSRKVGAKFGVILTRKYGHDIEVATFRSDGSYSDGRRPDSVTFGTAEQDALRRDFTINGLFFDPVDERVIDFVNGRVDLQARLIRTIGDPTTRFGEDHLRLLRAVRFASSLEFSIDPGTLKAIGAQAATLAAISPERIWRELDLMLSSKHRASGWSLLVETRLCDHLAPAWRPNAGQAATVLRRLTELADTGADSTVSLAAVLLDDGASTALRVARLLKLSNRQCEAIAWLIRSAPRLLIDPNMELADLKTLMAHVRWEDAIRLARADLRARGADETAWRTLLDRAAAIPAGEIAPAPLLTGDMLTSLGIPPGPRFGGVLKYVYRAQLNGEIRTVDDAVELARRHLAQDQPSTST